MMVFSRVFWGWTMAKDKDKIIIPTNHNYPGKEYITKFKTGPHKNKKDKRKDDKERKEIEQSED